MKISGTLAELMARTDPKLYQKYVTLENNTQVLYLRLQKALYGMMKSTLLFYKKLVRELRDIGFEINPYDPCVANKMVDGSQITVRWHVDDLMISHIKSGVINELLRTIKGIYGETWLVMLATCRRQGEMSPIFVPTGQIWRHGFLCVCTLLCRDFPTLTYHEQTKFG
jgi:hypothetical protein